MITSSSNEMQSQQPNDKNQSDPGMLKEQKMSGIETTIDQPLDYETETGIT